MCQERKVDWETGGEDRAAGFDLRPYQAFSRVLYTSSDTFRYEKNKMSVSSQGETVREPTIIFLANAIRL